MIHKYRTQFTACTDSGPASVEGIQVLAREWIARKESVPSGALEKEGDYDLKSGSSISLRHDIVGSSEQWALRYRRPDDRDSLNWIVDLAVAHDGASALVSVAMGLELEEHRIVRVARRIRPPAIVQQLAARYQLTAGCTIAEQPRQIGPDEVVVFSSWARSANRVLPIVVITTDSITGHPLINPASVQRLLLGLGEVVLLPKRSAQELGRTLEALLGGRSMAKLWGVFGGAVRVYWPGLDVMSPDATPFAHKLWIPDSQGQLSRQVEEELFDSLAWAATHRRYERWTDFRSIERGRDMEQLQRLAGNDSGNKGELQRVIRRLEADNADLRAQVAAGELTLRDSLANCEEAWQQVRDLQAQNAQLRGAFEGVRPVIDSVDAAVSKARTEFSRTLCFADDLTVDTRQSGEYWFSVLGALHDLCLAYNEGLIEGHADVDTRIPELLEARGCNRKRPKHADTGVEKIDSRTGRRVHLRWRLHLRSGAPGESESIYWEPMRFDEAMYLLIGWIGNHPD